MRTDINICFNIFLSLPLKQILFFLPAQIAIYSIIPFQISDIFFQFPVAVIAEHMLQGTPFFFCRLGFDSRPDQKIFIILMPFIHILCKLFPFFRKAHIPVTIL